MLTDSQTDRIDAIESKYPEFRFISAYGWYHVEVSFSKTYFMRMVAGYHTIAAFRDPEQAICRLETESEIWRSKPVADRMARYSDAIMDQMWIDHQKRLARCASR